MEAATDCIVWQTEAGCDAGSLAIAHLDGREPQMPTLESDDSGRGSPDDEEQAAPSEAGNETTSSSTLSQDEEGAIEEMGWAALRHLDVWEAPIRSADSDSRRVSAEQLGVPGSLLQGITSSPSLSQNAETQESAAATVGLADRKHLTNVPLVESTLEMLPVGRSIDVGACIVLGNLACHPRVTLDEWFGPYLDIIRHALPLSRGYFVIPRLEQLCETGDADLYLEVRRMVSRHPLKMRTVLLITGRNAPAGRAWFPDFKEIVQDTCSVLGRRILQRNQHAQIYWLGFFGFWWNFGVQRHGQQVELLSSQPQAWIDIEDAASFYRLQQLASEIDKAFPLRADGDGDETGSTAESALHAIALLMEHFSKNDERCTTPMTRALWNGPWIELLAGSFPGMEGYVVQPEAVDVWSAKDPPLLKVIKASVSVKGETSLDTVLLFVSRGTDGPLPKYCGASVTIDKALVKAYMKTVFGYRFPTQWLCVPMSLPVCWIYAAGAGWIGGIVGPEEKQPQTDQKQEGREGSWCSMPFDLIDEGGCGDSTDDEDAFDVQVLTEWNTNAYTRASRRNLRKLARRTLAFDS